MRALRECHPSASGRAKPKSLNPKDSQHGRRRRRPHQSRPDARPWTMARTRCLSPGLSRTSGLSVENRRRRKPIGPSAADRVPFNIARADKRGDQRDRAQVRPRPRPRKAPPISSSCRLRPRRHAHGRREETPSLTPRAANHVPFARRGSPTRCARRACAAADRPDRLTRCTSQIQQRQAEGVDVFVRAPRRSLILHR